MDLIHQLNETVMQTEVEDTIFMENCTAAANSAGVELEELAESILNWLTDINQQVRTGTLLKPKADNTAAAADHADKMRDTAEIMGAIAALSDPVNAEAMNVKNPAKILNLANSDDPQSDLALQFLKGKGRSEAKYETNRMAEILQSGDQQAIVAMMQKLYKGAKRALEPAEAQPEQQGQATQHQPGSLGLKGAMNNRPEI